MLLSDKGINAQSIALLRMSADKRTALGGWRITSTRFVQANRPMAKLQAE
jgi:hypothetical protein